MSLLLKNNVFKPKMLNQIDLAPCHGNPDLGQKGPNLKRTIVKSKKANFS